MHISIYLFSWVLYLARIVLGNFSILTIPLKCSGRISEPVELLYLCILSVICFKMWRIVLVYHIFTYCKGRYLWFTSTHILTNILVSLSLIGINFLHAFTNVIINHLLNKQPILLWPVCSLMSSNGLTVIVTLVVLSL